MKSNVHVACCTQCIPPLPLVAIEVSPSRTWSNIFFIEKKDSFKDPTGISPRYHQQVEIIIKYNDSDAVN